jgi:hypothetical protein
MCHRQGSIKAGMINVWRCSTSGVSRCLTARSQVMTHWGATRGFAVAQFTITCHA